MPDRLTTITQRRDWLEASYEFNLATRLLQRLAPAIELTQGEPWRLWCCATNALSHPTVCTQSQRWHYLNIPQKAGLRRVIAMLVNCSALIDCATLPSTEASHARTQQVIQEAIRHLLAYDLCAAKIALQAQPQTLIKMVDPLHESSNAWLGQVRRFDWLVRMSQRALPLPRQLVTAWQESVSRLSKQRQFFDPFLLTITKGNISSQSGEVAIYYAANSSSPITLIDSPATMNDVGDYELLPDENYIALAMQAFYDGALDMHSLASSTTLNFIEFNQWIKALLQTAENIQEHLLLSAARYPDLTDQLPSSVDSLIGSTHEVVECLVALQKSYQVKIEPFAPSSRLMHQPQANSHATWEVHLHA